MKMALQIRSVMPLKDSIEIARLAEDHGYDTVWLSEGFGHNDAVTSVTAAALNTSRIKVGSSVMVVYLRHPVLMGMTAKSLAEISNDRFVLGLGTGHRNQLEEFYGLSQERPVRYMREYIDVVRMAASGRSSSYDGEIFNIRGYHARTTYELEETRLPIFMGVLNEQMLRLAGRIADGVILAYTPKSHIRQARTWIAESATEAGRNPDEITIAAVVPAGVSIDGTTAEDALRLRIASYASLPDHNRMLRAGGHGDAIDAVQEYLDQGDWPAVARGLSEELVAEIGTAGTPERCRQAAESYAGTGLDMLIVIPVAMPDRSDAQHHADVVKAFAP